MTLTAEQLTEAIRQADNLASLKHLVGPSEQIRVTYEQRLERIEALYEQYGLELLDWPADMLEEYNQLVDEQDQFERQYG